MSKALHVGVCLLLQQSSIAPLSAERGGARAKAAIKGAIGKTVIAVMRPCGEMAIPLFEFRNTDVELAELSKLLWKL